jgi:dephospho-CoA kinase
MTVYGFVGLPGSGKSEAADVARERGLPVVTMGDVIRRECRDRGVDPATEHGRVARALREEHGEGAVVEDALRGGDAVVVDGIRSDVEVEQFEEAFGDAFTLVRIDAPYETRAERLELRSRDAGDDEGGEALRERDQRELDFGMGDAMERADLTVENDGSLEAFRRRIRSVLER